MKAIIVAIGFIFFWIFFIMALVGIIKPSLIGKLVSYFPNPIGEFLGKINTGNFVTSRIKTVIVYLLMALLMFNIQMHLDVSGNVLPRARQAIEDRDYKRAEFLLIEGIDEGDKNYDEAQKLLFTAGKKLFEESDTSSQGGYAIINWRVFKLRYAKLWLNRIKDDDENYGEAQKLWKLATGNYHWYEFNDPRSKDYENLSEKYSDQMKTLKSIPEGHPFADSITVGIDKLRSRRREGVLRGLTYGNPDWCYPDCQNATGAFKFSNNRTFNHSMAYYGGSTRNGLFYIYSSSIDEWFNNNFEGPIAIHLEYFDGGENKIYYYGNQLQVGETWYDKYTTGD